MTDKQYADMATITMFGRIFADQMRKCLVNSGLWDKGFGISVDAFRTKCSDGFEVTGAVRLIRGYDNDENDHDDDMEQIQYFGERWAVCRDPKAETGSIPPEVHIKKQRDVGERTGKVETKPLPPDGLWVGADYNYPHVGGGR